MTTLYLDTSEIKRLRKAVAAISRKMRHIPTFTRALGPLLKAQTQRRINSEKTSPEGGPWKPWSVGYAKTRIPGKHSLLIDTKAMVSRIKWNAYANNVEAGSAQPYAGYVNAIRPFVGLSESNASEIEQLAISIIQGFLDNASEAAGW